MRTAATGFESRAPSDFLLPLTAGQMVILATSIAVGAVTGSIVGRQFLRQYEARATVKLATVAFTGPVISAAELAARAQSRDLLGATLASIHSPQPPEAYKVQTEWDASLGSNASLLSFSVSGSHPDVCAAVAASILDSLSQVSHRAYLSATADEEQQLLSASRAAQGLRDGAGPSPVPAAAAVSVGRWADKLKKSHELLKKNVLDSRDFEVIDRPFVRDIPSRTLALAALGAFVGMLLGLAVAARPEAPREAS